MGTHFRHLPHSGRYQIEGFLQSVYTQAAIAAEIGVSQSTISREIQRNRGQRGYPTCKC
ncbi:MAG: helix-turn-helix domain-containing protein [Aestuariivita sp.]|nr:helix-turn-helix domain-containing protein [Aestuariivita sp.]MCY4345264.1 helix-turn-helix domain-containing protein [Aestuariivita sp.]